MTSPIQLTKTCIACGTQKPLGAFLQLSGTNGTSYGNVCNACRGSEAKTNEQIIIDDEERGTTSSGLRIDAEEKKLTELQDKKHEKDKEEAKRQDRLERDTLLTEKTERSDLQQKNEKEHRDRFIHAQKKQSFLSFQSKKRPITITQRTLDDTQAATEKNQQTLETHRVDAVKEEQRITSTDLTVPTLGIRTDEARHQSATFQGFQAFLGKSAPIVKAMNTAEKLANKTKEKTHPDDEPTNFVNNSWRRR